MKIYPVNSSFMCYLNKKKKTYGSLIDDKYINIILICIIAFLFLCSITSYPEIHNKLLPFVIGYPLDILVHWCINQRPYTNACLDPSQFTVAPQATS